MLVARIKLRATRNKSATRNLLRATSCAGVNAALLTPAVRRRLVERRHIAATWRRTAVSSRLFCTFWPCDLDLWPFDLVFIGGRGNMLDYHCAKFGDFSFSRFDFILRTDTNTNRQTDRHNHIADQRYTHTTPVGMIRYIMKTRTPKKSKLTR